MIFPPTTDVLTYPLDHNYIPKLMIKLNVYYFKIFFSHSVSYFMYTVLFIDYPLICLLNYITILPPTTDVLTYPLDRITTI